MGARTAMLSIEDLQARVDGKPILNGLTLEVGAGEVHAIMGPNGSGKSTLAYVLAGRPGYEVTGGRVLFEGRDLLALAPGGARPRRPVPRLPVPGGDPGRQQRLSAQGGRQCRAQGSAASPRSMPSSSWGWCARRWQLMRMEDSFLSRGVNEGFSGGEKKRNEILQMLVLEPRLAILDETDSGLDIDALKVVAAGVNSLRSPERACVLVTHYQRLLEYVVPDFVHVLVRGRIATQRRPQPRARARAARLRLGRRRGGMSSLTPALAQRLAAEHASAARALTGPALGAAQRRARGAPGCRTADHARRELEVRQPARAREAALPAGGNRGRACRARHRRAAARHGAAVRTLRVRRRRPGAGAVGPAGRRRRNASPCMTARRAP